MISCIFLITHVRKEYSHFKSKFFHIISSARKCFRTISPAAEITLPAGITGTQLRVTNTRQQHYPDCSLPVIPKLPTFKSTNVLFKCCPKLFSLLPICLQTSVLKNFYGVCAITQIIEQKHTTDQVLMVKYLTPLSPHQNTAHLAITSTK